jgi:mono/diheme cytochrome c family protein
MRRLFTILVVALILAAVVFLTRGIGFTSRLRPLPFESTASHAARRWATPPALIAQANPVPSSDEVLKDAMAHWADHCATCHGNDGKGTTTIGGSLYPPAPDMQAAATQQMSDGELFYVIERGIPLTGMPAWGNGTAEGERSSWALVRFIRRLPQLTAADLAAMEKMNPKSGADRDRERQIEEFLNAK